MAADWSELDSIINDSSCDGACDDDNSSEGDRENLFDYFKKNLPDDIKEYMDEELKCSPVLNFFKNFMGCVFWSRKDDEPERPPSLSDDILDFKKKIRDVLCTILWRWPECTLVQFWAPITTSEGQSFLTTQNQPFALKSTDDEDDIALAVELFRYRMISKDYKFYMDLDGESSGEKIGLVGPSVQTSTPRIHSQCGVLLYHRISTAQNYVRQSLALPVFERSTQRCVGVLEVVTPMICLIGSSLIRDYYHYDMEINEGFEGCWTDEEVKVATGNAESQVVAHPLKLISSYATVKGSTRTRGFNGEPLATSYH